jgi:hypothetical protein
MIARSVVGEDSKLYIYHDGGDLSNGSASRSASTVSTERMTSSSSMHQHRIRARYLDNVENREALVLDDGMFDDAIIPGSR